MIVVLDNIRSVHNVGSIFRTADAADIGCIYLGGFTPAPFDRLGRKRGDFTKVSLGAEDTVLWKKYVSTARLLEKLKKDGYQIFAIEQSRNSMPYYNLQLSTDALQRTVLVLGNEIRGLSPTILKRADKVLEIPMFGKKESLNVAVAFGIVVFHLVTMKK